LKLFSPFQGFIQEWHGRDCERLLKAMKKTLTYPVMSFECTKLEFADLYKLFHVWPWRRGLPSGFVSACRRGDWSYGL
jgi:hypothetical protein